MATVELTAENFESDGGRQVEDPQVAGIVLTGGRNM